MPSEDSLLSYFTEQGMFVSIPLCLYNFISDLSICFLRTGKDTGSVHNSRRPSFSRRPSYRVAFAHEEQPAHARLSDIAPVSDGAQPPVDSSTAPVAATAASDPSLPAVDASDVVLTELPTSQIDSTSNAVVEEAPMEPSKIEVEKEEVEEGPSEADQLRKMLEQELHLIEKNHYPIPVRKIKRSVYKPLNGNVDALDADGALVGASEEGQDGHGEEEEDANVVAYAAKNAQLREEYEVYISRLMNKLMVSVYIRIYTNYYLYHKLILQIICIYRRSSSIGLKLRTSSRK